MDDLVQWLGEQLDEDERIARACSGDGQWAERDIAIYGPYLGVEVLAHMAQHDPARVLREIKAKRGVLRQYEAVRGQVRNPVSAENRWAARIAQGELEDVVRLLAVPYSDRPGYREEWRP